MKDTQKAQKPPVISRAKAVAIALSSVRAEGLEPSAAVKARLKRYADGKVSGAEIYAETLREAKQTGTARIVR